MVLGEGGVALYFEDPVNATTSLLRPGFYGPTAVVLMGYHCIKTLQYSSAELQS